MSHLFDASLHGFVGLSTLGPHGVLVARLARGVAWHMAGADTRRRGGAACWLQAGRSMGTIIRHNCLSIANVTQAAIIIHHIIPFAILAKALFART